MTDGFKTCSRCHETKPVSDFYKHRNRESVYKSACKDCMRVARGFKTAKPKGSRKRQQFAIVTAHVATNRLYISERFVL